MKDEIISYREMCNNENIQTLQRGMNYRLNANYSVILMSQRTNAPYKDRILVDGYTIEYEGHDVPRTKEIVYPKTIDQPRLTNGGRLTQNGLFASAADEFKQSKRDAEIVRVYEKIWAGIWSEKGFFKLINYKYLKDENDRFVFRFILEETDSLFFDKQKNTIKPRTRIIPSAIKQKVWARDKGKCVICGATDELHFDHDLPYSKGGTSITAENVRILCARHNLQKSDKIE
jgi:hypothetical protein